MSLQDLKLLNLKCSIPFVIKSIYNNGGRTSEIVRKPGTIAKLEKSYSSGL